MPNSVLAIFKISCYDCHSNNTIYPWYAQIQPVGWWLNSHIKDGKTALNFNEFGSYSLKRKLNKLKAIRNETAEGGMPLSSYTLIHRYARLTDEQKKLVGDWASASAASLEPQ